MLEAAYGPDEDEDEDEAEAEDLDGAGADPAGGDDPEPTDYE
jgi:hypothetical protein